MTIEEILDYIDTEEFASDYEKREKKQRLMLFKVLGIEDDGRRCSRMTEEEFRSFNKPCKDSHEGDLEGKTCVEIYFNFEAFYDVAYDYCFEDDTVYERRLYIGD